MGYDVAPVFGVLNGEPPEGRPALNRKVYDCLNPGGRIVLRDFVLNDDRAGPPEAAIFALQMLLAIEAGGLDTPADWARWLAEPGSHPRRPSHCPTQSGLPWPLLRNQLIEPGETSPMKDLEDAKRFHGAFAPG